MEGGGDLGAVWWAAGGGAPRAAGSPGVSRELCEPDILLPRIDQLKLKDAYHQRQQNVSSSVFLAIIFKFS
jgi:hypothetical protein